MAQIRLPPPPGTRIRSKKGKKLHSKLKTFTMDERKKVLNALRKVDGAFMRSGSDARTIVLICEKRNKLDDLERLINRIKDEQVPMAIKLRGRTKSPSIRIDRNLSSSEKSMLASFLGIEEDEIDTQCDEYGCWLFLSQRAGQQLVNLRHQNSMIPIDILSILHLIRWST